MTFFIGMKLPKDLSWARIIAQNRRVTRRKSRSVYRQIARINPKFCPSEGGPGN